MNKAQNTFKQCTVLMTRACNLRCDFCFEKEAEYRPDDSLSYEELRQIVDLCGEANMKYVFLTGGEALMHPHILDILRYIKDRYPSIIPTIATNGVLLRDFDFCKQLVESGLKYVDVSMKGFDTVSWKRSTGYDGFTDQLKAISNLAALPIEFTCSMVINPESVAGVCDAVQAAHDKGANQFSFTFFIDNIESEEKDLKYLEKHNPFALIEAFHCQTERLSAITDDWWIEYSYPLCVYTRKQLKALEGRLAGPCQIHLMNAITVDTQMDLLPCDMYATTKLGHIGCEISSYPELEKWVNSYSVRSTMNNIRSLPSSECSTCEHLERCYGGCPVLWKNYSFKALTDFKNANLQ